jgi:hypothetical protein
MPGEARWSMERLSALAEYAKVRWTPGFPLLLLCPTHRTAMPHMLLIVEPPGQRAERGRVDGEAVYQRMLEFSAELQAAGLLLGVNSLGTASRRLTRREGSVHVVDGPFAEAKEMVGGYFLLDTDDPGVAQAWAERCPAAEWATVEIRGVGPCYT